MAAEERTSSRFWAADFGWFGFGAYHRGIVGCRRPNSDRIATGEGELCALRYNSWRFTSSGRAQLVNVTKTVPAQSRR